MCITKGRKGKEERKEGRKGKEGRCVCACKYICVHTHTHTHINIHIYTTKGWKGKEGRKEGKGRGRKGRKEGTKEGREEGRKGKNEKEGKGGAPRCLSKRHCHRRTLLCNSPRTAAHQQGTGWFPCTTSFSPSPCTLRSISVLGRLCYHLYRISSPGISPCPPSCTFLLVP